MNKIFIKLNIFLLVILMASFNRTFAVSLYLVQTPNTNITSGLISYDVMLDTEGTPVNTAAGKLSFPSEIFDVESISTIDSIVLNWLTVPRISKEIDLDTRDRIEWEGIIPGGFIGIRSPYYSGVKPGKIFTIVLRPKAEGSVTFLFENLDIRLHDGLGTKANVTTPEFSIEVPKIPDIQKAPTRKKNNLLINSKTLFAYVTKNNLIENDKWFVTFGEDTTRYTIDHYEIAESGEYSPDNVYFYTWRTATSPYILYNQNRNQFVHVKAVYENGDYSYITVAPVENSKTSDITSRILILIVIVIAIIAITKKIYAHRRKIISHKKQNTN